MFTRLAKMSYTEFNFAVNLYGTAFSDDEWTGFNLIFPGIMQLHFSVNTNYGVPRELLFVDAYYVSKQLSHLKHIKQHENK